MNDLISRQAAIDTLTNYFAKWAEYADWNRAVKNMVNVAQNSIKEMLIQLPSAQTELNTQLYTDGFVDGYAQCKKDKAQWIPCSERLPEEDTYVLATTAWGEITMAEKLSDIAWFIYEGNANATSDDIVAWMPLPEPYKGEQPC